MEKREASSTYGAHVLAIPYPSQGHINPMLQFCRRLTSKGIKSTLAITNYISDSLNPISDTHVNLATFSDGYDDGGYSEAETTDAYVARLEAIGSESLGDLIKSHGRTSYPITCLVYDSFLPWALDVGKKHGLKGAAFFTQACAVNFVYYWIYHGKLTMPVSSSLLPVEIPGLPLLKVGDLPSFVGSPESYPAYLELVLNQNGNLDKADFVLVNTYYELENEVIDEMSRYCPLLTIGPTVPSFYLDNRIEYDKDYNLNLYHIDSMTSTKCITWLSTKPPNSVVYVSFGSMACLPKEQVEELAWGLKGSHYPFLWVVRASEESKLPSDYTKAIREEEGLIVRWSSQLEVLDSEAIGCFVTHCGWNSTLEALTLGVPMIGMPQWTDQPIDAKFVEDVWKVGVRVKMDEKGLVRREEIMGSIMDVMVGESREGIMGNVKRWKDLAEEAVSQGGSSDRNIEYFVSQITMEN